MSIRHFVVVSLVVVNSGSVDIAAVRCDWALVSSVPETAVNACDEGDAVSLATSSLCSQKRFIS